jgi:hypothetical protein
VITTLWASGSFATGVTRDSDMGSNNNKINNFLAIVAKSGKAVKSRDVQGRVSFQPNFVKGLKS